MSNLSKNERWYKFQQYWRDMGRPELEVQFCYTGDWLICWDEQDSQVDAAEPTFSEMNNYRIAGDRNWLLRHYWVNSNEEIKLEYLSPGGEWLECSYLPIYSCTTYREAMS